MLSLSHTTQHTKFCLRMFSILPSLPHQHWAFFGQPVLRWNLHATVCRYTLYILCIFRDVSVQNGWKMADKMPSFSNIAGKLKKLLRQGLSGWNLSLSLSACIYVYICKSQISLSVCTNIYINLKSLSLYVHIYYLYI